MINCGGWRKSIDFNRTPARVSNPRTCSASHHKYMRNIRFVVIGDPAGLTGGVYVPTERITKRGGKGEEGKRETRQPLLFPFSPLPLFPSYLFYLANQLSYSLVSSD